MAVGAVLVTGLRRSGTTILWETLRRDAGVVCFDEPFHPRLWQGARQNAKGTWDELGRFWDRELAEGAGDLRPIEPLDELDAGSSAEQVAYLDSLMRAGDRVAIDVVRAWNRLPELLPAGQSVHVVHLLRDPIDWVGAHLLPSGAGTWRKPIVDRYRRATFFTRRGFYDNWQYEEIIEAALARDHPMWRHVSLAPAELQREPAFVKLAAFWWVANLETHRRLARWSGGPVGTVTLAEFARDPARVIAAIYRDSQWQLPDRGLGYAHVAPVRPSWQATSPRWGRAFAQLGLPAELLEGHALTGCDMGRIFSEASSRDQRASPVPRFAQQAG